MTTTAIRWMDDPLYDELHGDGPDAGVGVGQLVSLSGSGEVALPLRGTTVRASLAGPCADVSVTQRFTNDRDVPLECVYVFPLPPASGVVSLVFTVGDRQLRAELKERGAAERDYEAARDSGHRASLLTAERADVFTTRVANIQPGEEVEVALRLVMAMPFDDGGFVFRFPLVLADRYIPGAAVDGAPSGDGVAPDTDQVPDASRISPPRLLPGVRPAHDLDIDVHLLPGHPDIADLVCSQHATSIGWAEGRVRVSLARRDELPNRDFILRVRFAAEQTRGALWTAQDDDGVRFVATLLPPSEIPASGAVPREVVLLVDVSGSMRGPKMPAAIEAARLVLRGLRGGDALQVVAFHSTHRKLWRQPKAAVQETIAEADRFLVGLSASGGTEMLSPLRDVLRKPPTASRVRHVVLITDGQVGNEAAIVREVAGLDQPLRVFAVGIDTAVNEAFCESLARETRGLACLMTPSDPIAERMTRFLATVGSPVATDVQLVGMEVEELFPARIPDLYQGRPVVVAGRLAVAPSDAAGAAAVMTLPDGTRFEVPFATPQVGGEAVFRTVGTARVAELEQRWQLHKQSADRSALLKASLEEEILSVLTGLVVVDDRPTDGEEAESVVVPVMPADGWAMYDTPSPRVGGAPPPPGPSMPFPAAAQSPAFSRHAPAPKRARAPKRGGGPIHAVAQAMGSVFARSEREEDLDLADAAIDACAPSGGLMERASAGPSGPSGPPSLSALVLQQLFDGSFPPEGHDSVHEATAAALLRLVEAGNTDLRGPHRQSVAKAAAFLLTALPDLEADGDAREATVEALTAWADATGTDASRRRLQAALDG
jgi:Ca-activated chloride channel homolog